LVAEFAVERIPPSDWEQLVAECSNSGFSPPKKSEFGGGITGFENYANSRGIAPLLRGAGGRLDSSSLDLGLVAKQGYAPLSFAFR
jgi:hypothetical protein